MSIVSSEFVSFQLEGEVLLNDDTFQALALPLVAEMKACHMPEKLRQSGNYEFSIFHQL